VAQRDGNAIGRVRRARRGAQPQQPLHHELDLLLRRAARACDGILDLGRRILEDGQLPRSAPASRIAPRAWPRITVVRAFLAKNTPSTAMASIEWRVMTSTSPSWISRSRCASGVDGRVRITPHSRSETAPSPARETTP
jgi:hypothetical protein